MSINILDLPTEILEYIFASQSPRDICAFSATCKSAHAIISTDSFWTSALEQQWGKSVTPVDQSDSLNRFRTLYSSKHWQTASVSSTTFTLSGNVFGVSMFDNRIVSGDNDSNVTVWDIDSETILRQIKTPKVVLDIDLDQSHSTILELLRGNKFEIIDFEQLQVVATGSMQANSGHFIAGDQSVAVGGDAIVGVVDLRHPTVNSCMFHSLCHSCN